MQMTIKIKLMILAIMAVAGFAVLVMQNIQAGRFAVAATGVVREEANSALFVKEQRLILANILNTVRVAATVEEPSYLPDPWTDAVSDDFFKLKEAQGELESIAERIGASPEPLVKYEKALVMLDSLLQINLVAAMESGAPRTILDDMMVDAVELGLSMDIYLGDLEANFAATMIDSTDMSMEIARESYLMLVVGVTSSLLFMIVALMLARSITVPLAHMTDAMTKLAEGDMTVEVPGLGRADEIGAMAEPLARIKETLSGARRR